MTPLVLLDGDVIGRSRTGDETYTVNLLRSLPEAAPELRFACSLRDPGLLPDGVPESVERLQLDVSSPYRRIPFSFPVLARAQGAAVAHVHYFVAPRMPCPVVVTVHDASYARAPELFSWRDRLLFRFVAGSVRRATRVIAVSEFTRQDVIDLYGLAPESVHAIPNGVDRRFAPRPGAASAVRAAFGLDAPYVLTVGALQPRKNVPRLIEAFASAAPGDHVLAVVGGDRGGRDAVLSAAARCGLGERLRLLGHVGEDALPDLYSGARALAFPSLYEGFGLPALEAMACGAPVVASRTTGLGEAVGDAALTVDPTSVDELAEALSRVLSDEALRARLIAAGLARAAEFTWGKAAARTADVYRQLV